MASSYADNQSMDTEMETQQPEDMERLNAINIERLAQYEPIMIKFIQNGDTNSV